MRTGLGRLATLACALALVALTATAAGAADPDDDADDPLEGLNRSLYDVNRVLDGLLLKPAAMVYRGVLPEEVRDGVRNVLDNLKGPVILANDLMQGESTRAGVTLKRFAVNSTVGMLGVRDAASAEGLYRHDEDFGQTLAVWGIGGGPYLFLPLLGPTNPRDVTGMLVDNFVIDPWGHMARATDNDWFSYTRFGLDVLDTRARNIEALDDIERNQIDPYAFIRTTSRQRRASEILNGRPASGAR
ncbi:MAG: VacJ family lipoprotein [Alphaproteobacteria bacterium]|nr:VacJ family lipoprotein [Alphaproteobacteria bacterium]